MVPSYMNDGDIIEALLALARAMTFNVNRGVEPRVDVLESTKTSIWRDFVRINPPISLGSKVGEDPQEFPDGVYKMLSDMG